VEASGGEQRGKDQALPPAVVEASGGEQRGED